MSADRRRILIVDDQPANVRTLAEALGDGYELFFATDGQRAVDRALAGGIDLVLLDVVMPGLSGFEVCRRLKADERSRAVPVIFVSSLGEVADETAGFEAGGVDYITKPVSPPIVRARVRTQIELKEARDRLEALASLDGLTGVANRRRFDAFLDSEYRRALRSGHWLSLAILDVDLFKAFNDRYGHARGDDCLRNVARALAAGCRRTSDLSARYGGEEFALVLPETGPEGARTAGRAVLEAVRALAIPHEASPVVPFVTVSLGTVSLVPDPDSTPAAAMAEADRLLYQAKEGGRDHGLHADLLTGERQRIDAKV